MNGTPFSRPNVRGTKNPEVVGPIQIGRVYQSNIPVLAPDRWTAITKSIHNGVDANTTPDEAQFIAYYMELVKQARKLHG